MISVDTYATPSSHMFVLRPYQHMQLWTTADFPVCNPNQPAPIITVITINSTRADRAITSISQLRLHASIDVIHNSFFPRRRGHFPSPQDTHTASPQLVVFLYYCTIHRQLLSVGPSYHTCSCPLRHTSINYSGCYPLSVFLFHSTY